MSLLEGIRLASAFAYALLPYSALYLLIRRKERTVEWSELLLAAAWGLAGFVVVAIPVASVNLSVYCILHAALSAPCALWLIYAFRNQLRMSRSFHLLPATLLGLALLVRLLPYLPQEHWLGFGDMRFHNILAKSIEINNALPRTWEPFASIPVNYPLGGHLIASFVSLHSSVPIHTALNVSLCLYGMLSTGLIYLLAHHIFGSRSSALVSMISYGFIALAGSLDYVRWGGMPNALAMTLLLLFVLELLRRTDDSPIFKASDTFPSLIAAAIVLTHHYTALAMFLLVGGLIFLSPLKQLTKRAILNSLLGSLVAIALLRMCGLLPDISIGNTSVLVFHEHPIALPEMLISMNPTFALLSGTGLYLILKNRIPAAMSLITAWVISYFAAFVALEYCYRLGVFILSDGLLFHTAFTPSRLIADAAYPLSLAVGAIALHSTFDRYRVHAVAILASIGLASSLMMFFATQSATPVKGSVATMEWLRDNAADNAVIVGSLPHLEYMTWKKSSAPPIPASEARNAPELVEMRGMTNLTQWEAYETRQNKECFFILEATPSAIPDALTAVYSTGALTVCVFEADHE